MDAAPKLENLRKLSSQRLPPPVLFQGPPSHNASNLSLAPPLSTSPGGSQSVPLQRGRPSRATGSFDAASLSPFVSRAQSKGEVDRSEAIWQEMQNALSEVELSAVTSEHVFGEKHSEALEDLRVKQLKLAQAWTRSEADEVVDAKGAESKRISSTRRDSQNVGPTGERIPTDNLSHRKMDEETEKDIQLARERREANDRYFDRVNNGVLEVVAKLEEVAQAMRAVEKESKDIWSDNESMNTATPPATNAS
ncbi:DUF5315 domain-containing protein [Aspergillus clavatus NRRL 1]|uniref:Uncharacterized protein n=1 Tax=Aspergillus clavatus (strain ATCC 1007 / CBS 513.65 / DSM 816 / NCTC 3887 / NRRL 1 / QM 1276 / 107) TaxID=344612 RepID=A1CQG9_ASPCL|nr:uncharacterized protein ACLA_026070 [Aspergillus clavatus NRRL 1]EAW07890.1 conserved hypothetical protein [Aspergillus clavatus NRRL 1]